MDAMMYSAGASEPMRPVCEGRTRVDAKERAMYKDNH